MNDALGRRAAWVGWTGSLLAHTWIALLVSQGLVLPDGGFEFQSPAQVELGLVEATEVDPPLAPSPSDPQPPAPAVDPPPAADGLEAAHDAGAARDAGARDGGVPLDAARRRRDAGADAGGEAGSLVGGLGAGPLVAFLPAGAQLALRLDFDRIRGSPIGQDVASLLRVLPDWRGLIEGSGVDPVRDLSRVLVATATLRREGIVVAGRLSEQAPPPRAIAEHIAAARGVDLAWQRAGGLDRTRWPSPDGIPRDVALLGERHFVIARSEDLPRVLAIAVARRGRRAPPDIAPAEALLSMDEGEGLSVEVENVPVFVRRSPCVLPERLRVGIVEQQDGARVRGEARFASAEQADEARACLADIARRYAGNVIVALYGIAGPLERLDLETDERLLRMETSIRYAELTTVFGLLRGLFERPSDSAAPPAPPVLPPPPPSPYE